MTSEVTVEDPLVSVQLYMNARFFLVRVTVHLMLSFTLQEKPKNVFLPPYN